MTDIVSVLNLINYGFVLIFGIIVSFYFAGIQWEDNKRLFILTTVLFVLFQALFYVLLGENVLFKCYPVLIHIPLILIIRYICHQNIYISFIAVMSAYLMCTPRKWFGTLAKYIFPEIPIISDVVTIVITIPLLIVVIKYISPYIIKLENESKTILSLYCTFYYLSLLLLFWTGKMQLNGKILSCWLLLRRLKKRFPSCMNIKGRLLYIVMISGIIWTFYRAAWMKINIHKHRII